MRAGLVSLSFSRNASSLLLNLDTNALSLSPSCVLRLGLAMPANLDRLLEQMQFQWIESHFKTYRDDRK